MKCERCGNELRLGNEQVGFDQQKNPVIHQFAYCDNCRMKWDLSMQQQAYSNVQNDSRPPAKKDSVLSILAIIFSLFGCLFFVGLIIAIIDLCINDKKTRHIGSWVALVFSIIWIIIGIGNMSSNDTSTENNNTTTQQTVIVDNSESQNIVQDNPEDDIIDFTYSNIYVKFLDSTIEYDEYNGKQLIVYFEMTNNSETNQTFVYNFDVKGFQNGIELDTNYIYDCDEEKNTSKEIQPGATIKVAEVFDLSEDTNSVTIEIRPLISFDDEKLLDFKIELE